MVDEEQGASFKVGPEMLEKYGVSEDVLFHAAMDCTKPLIKIQDMTSSVAEMMKISVDEAIKMQGGNPSMIVVTNKSITNGSSTICFTDVLKEIADRYESDLAILPSSIHECILYLDNAPCTTSAMMFFTDMCFPDCNTGRSRCTGMMKSCYSSC